MVGGETAAVAAATCLGPPSAPAAALMTTGPLTPGALSLTAVAVLCRGAVWTTGEMGTVVGLTEAWEVEAYEAGEE